MRWTRGFQVAKVASQHSNGSSAGKRMGSALFSGSSLIAIGFNVYNQTHPSSRTIRFNRNIHAEHKALLKRQHYDNTNMIMYVWRETRSGEPACSKPCSNCMWLMREAGIRRVRFIDSHGRFEELNI